MSFFWEEGYDREEAEKRLREELALKPKTISYDAKGENFLLHSVVTDLHHVHGVFCNTRNTIMLLNEPGKGSHQKNSFVAMYDVSGSTMEMEKSFTVGEELQPLGYMASSFNDKIVAVAVLKQDIVKIYEVSTGDLLIDLTGGQRHGFWGSLHFTSDSSCNDLVEMRVTALNKGKPKSCVIRKWNLGFCENKKESTGDCDSDDDSDDDDEVEEKLWEVKRTNGAVSLSKCGKEGLICSLENDGQFSLSGISQDYTTGSMEWLNANNGTISEIVEPKKWSAKCVVSKNGKYVATANFCHATVYDAVTGAMIAQVQSPDSAEVYPVVPVCFVDNDRFLVLRINYERTLILCDWRHSADSIDSMIAIQNVGGTISDDCVAVSADETKLVCWPYGVLELYDFAAMKTTLFRKMAKNLRIQCLLMRTLSEQKRAIPAASLSLTASFSTLIVQDKTDRNDSNKSAADTTKELKFIHKMINTQFDLFRSIMEFL